MVHGDNHHEHGEQAHRLSPPIALFNGEAHVGSQARESVIVFTENKGLAHHEEEPPARHRHHAIPEEAGCGEGEVEPPESFPPRHSGQVSDCDQLGGNGLQRRLKREGHVPHLPSEDHEHRGQFQSEVRIGEQVNQPEYEPRQEPQNRDALQDIEQRSQNAFRTGDPRHGIAVEQGEHKRQTISPHAPRQTVQRVQRQVPRLKVDVGSHTGQNELGAPGFPWAIGQSAPIWSRDIH